MGVVYTFAIGSLERVKLVNEKRLPTLQNLKKYLLKKEFDYEARFVCYDECERCSVVLDRNESEVVEDFFQEEPKLYSFNSLLGSLQRIEAESYFDQEDVEHRSCFSYRIYKNGVGEQIFVKYRNRVYDYSEYLDGVGVYDSLEDINTKKESLLQKVLL